MAAMLTCATSRLAKDPAVLRYDGQGRPVYRLGKAPDGLDTAAQLRARRLSRAGLTPVAWLYYSALYHRICPLYERAAARPIRPLTERQRQVLAEGRKLANTIPCKRCRQVRVSVWARRHLCTACRPIVEAEQHAARERRMQQEAEDHARMLARDQAAAAEWAADVLADPAAVALDLETTGLAAAYMVEIAVLACDGTVLLNTLVNPRVPIPAEATAIHGITDAMVADAPTFSEILPELTCVLSGRRTVIYNASFDTGILRNELERHYRAAEPDIAPEEWRTHPSTSKWMSALRTDCAMERYAQWFGEWNDYWQSYLWQRLGGGHRARGDCEATLERLRTMAGAVAAGGVAQ